MTDTDDLVLVLGATGKTGRRVAARLRLHGAPVRAASRTSATPFDWSDPATWDAALDDVAAVYLVAPTDPGPVAGFVARAQAAGVRRVVLLSGRGADTWGDSPFGRDMLAAEEAVRGSALEWTVLRPTNFVQNFDEDFLHGAVVDGELALPTGPLVEPMIDVEDVADVAATVLLEPGRHGGRVYELTGPRVLTYAEAVAMISRATGRHVAYREVTPAEHTRSLQARGFDAESAADITAMFALIADGLLADPTDGVASVLGREARRIEDYVVRTAAAGAWKH